MEEDRIMVRSLHKRLLNIFKYLCFVFISILIPVNFIAGSPVNAESVLESEIIPVIINFSVSPQSIESGNGAILSWEVKNALKINIDHGIGEVAPSGQLQINPSYTTTYKLTAFNNAGLRARYLTLDVSLKTASPLDDTIGVDPVTGRNASIDMTWEQLCLSKQYQVQIARDPGFTLKVYDSGVMLPADVAAPAFVYPPGNLEAGHTYYWRVRVRQAATGQYVLGPWSEPRPLIVQPGYAVRNEYYGIQHLSPVNGCSACPVKNMSFSWSGYPNTTKYRFILAKDSYLQNVVVETFTATTSYELKGTLDYDSTYFWQVAAIEPVPSDVSALFTFHTEPMAAQPAPENYTRAEEVPLWAIIVMVIGAILIGMAVYLIARLRRLR